MLLTSWLSLLRTDDLLSDPHRPRRAVSRSDPWRHAHTSFRSNPFVPPDRVRETFGSHSRRTERR